MKKLGIVGLMMLMALTGCSKKKEPGENVGMRQPGIFDTSLSRFKESFEKNDYSKAFEALRSCLEVLWEKSPLLANNVKFVTNDSSSFGIYTPRPNDEFAPGEVIYLYLEPVGQTLKKNAQGQYEFGFTADFSLEDESGKVLGGQKGFVNPTFTSWNFNTEIALTFNFTFSGLAKGQYKLLLTVKDIFSEKMALIDKRFSIS